MNTLCFPLTLALAAAPLLSAQDAAKAPKAPKAPAAPQVPAAAPAAPAPPAPVAAPTPSSEAGVDPALARQFRTRLFFVQHRSAGFIGQALKPLLSGVKGSTLDSNTSTDGLKTVSVRDFPENLAVIEEAFKRLDVPEVANTSRDVEFHIHVLFASAQLGPGEEAPEELKDVLATLKSTLKYKHYSHAATFTQRATAHTDGRVMNGGGQANVVCSSGKGERESVPMNLSWRFWPKFLEGGEGSALLNFQNFRVSAEEVISMTLGKAEVGGADIVLKSGETVVVGTSTMRDKALIVVLTAKALK